MEFPIYSDGEVIKQGSGEIIAYLLSGHNLESCVTRSDLLHGWISGLYPSQCPAGQENAFLELVRRLADGGLKVFAQADGRKPALLEALIRSGKVSGLALNILGPSDVYAESFGGELAGDDLAASIALARSFPKAQIRLFVSPTRRSDGAYSWTTKEEAAGAAKMVADACGDKQLPFFIDAVTDETPDGLHGLEPFAQNNFLPYRSACRSYLFKTDIVKRE